LLWWHLRECLPGCRLASDSLCWQFLFCYRDYLGAYAAPLVCGLHYKRFTVAIPHVFFAVESVDSTVLICEEVDTVYGRDLCFVFARLIELVVCKVVGRQSTVFIFIKVIVSPLLRRHLLRRLGGRRRLAGLFLPGLGGLAEFI
jgi:hypothetical protein